MTAKPKPPITAKGSALPDGGWRLEVSGYCPPSLNGSGGLMRAHWSKKEAAKAKAGMLIRQARPPQFMCAVRMEYTRYSPRKMDWVNMHSTIKVLEDMLVHEGVIVDDCPRWVPLPPNLNQIKGPLGFILDIFPVDKDD